MTIINTNMRSISYVPRMIIQ